MTAGLGVVPAGGAPQLAAASLTLRPVADAHVSSAAPDGTFGNARVLTVDRRPSVRSYLRFRLGRLGGPVRHASLWLHFASGSGRGVRVSAVRSRSWSERKVTYANAPGLGRTLAQGRVTSGWVEFDVTEGMPRSGAVDLALSSTAPPGKITLASREVRARAPQLVLSAGGSSADPVIAAAGNIACDPADPDFNGGLGTEARCRQQATSDLLSSRLAAVLSVGDSQYGACGGYSAYLQAYDRSWGRLKAITHPVPGEPRISQPDGRRRR